MNTRTPSPAVGRRTVLTGTAAVAALAAAPASAATSFRDVPKNHPFHTHITWLAQQGITTGWPDGTFRPDKPIERNAYAAFLYRLAGKPAYTPPARSPFRDMKTSSPFYLEVTWAQSKGYIRGWPDGTFRPHATINRDAAVVMLYRYAGSPKVTHYAPFKDVSTSYGFAKELGWSRNTGLMTGWQDQTFRPFERFTRADAAALFYRFVNGGVFGRGRTVIGQVAVAYWNAGGIWGPLGVPTANAITVKSGKSGTSATMQTFKGGQVFFYSRGAFAVRGSVFSAYKSAGGHTGSYGLPTSHQRSSGGAADQSFEGGVLPKPTGWRAPAGMHQPVTSITRVTGGVPLRRGWNGTRVRLVQRRLGIRRTGANQTYDYATEQAVRNFQRRNGLAADGVVGPKTWSKLVSGYPFTMDAWQTKPQLPLTASRSQRIETMIGFAMAQRGTPYTWGGAGYAKAREAGYDCSGLVLQALYAAGIDPQPINVVKHAEPTYRTSRMLYSDPKLKSVPLAQRKRGDLIFWGGSSGVVSHVAIYLGNNQIIESLNPDTRVNTYAGTRWGSTVFVKPTIKRPFA